MNSLVKYINLGLHEGFTNRAMIAELLRCNASMSGEEHIILNEYVDRMMNDIYSVIGESIAAVSSFFILGILRKKSLEEEVQCIDKTIDVLVLRQGQVPTTQLVHKTFGSATGSILGSSSRRSCRGRRLTIVSTQRPDSYFNSMSSM